jgi:hypothetical protein
VARLLGLEHLRWASPHGSVDALPQLHVGLQVANGTSGCEVNPSLILHTAPPADHLRGPKAMTKGVTARRSSPPRAASSRCFDGAPAVPSISRHSDGRGPMGGLESLFRVALFRFSLSGTPGCTTTPVWLRCGHILTSVDFLDPGSPASSGSELRSRRETARLSLRALADRGNFSASGAPRAGPHGRRRSQGVPGWARRRWCGHDGTGRRACRGTTLIPSAARTCRR